MVRLMLQKTKAKAKATLVTFQKKWLWMKSFGRWITWVKFCDRDKGRKKVWRTRWNEREWERLGDRRREISKIHHQNKDFRRCFKQSSLIFSVRNELKHLKVSLGFAMKFNSKQVCVISNERIYERRKNRREEEITRFIFFVFPFLGIF